MSVVHRQYATSDIDAATGALASAFAGGGMRLTGTGAFFRYEQDYRGTPELAVVSQQVSADVRARFDESETLFVGWTEAGRTTFQAGGLEVDGDRGLLWSGRAPAGGTVGHATNRALLLDRKAFETRARLLLAHDFALPHAAGLLSPEHLELVRRHADALVGTFLRDQVVDSPLAWQSVLDLTVATVLTAAGLDRPTEHLPHVPASIRRSIAFIDDNLAQPIGLADIAAASQLSARGLQAAFRQHLGQTPMERVRRARLVRVRTALTDAEPAQTSVAAVARQWGFTHLGRFAASYFDAFGELPGTTLRR